MSKNKKYIVQLANKGQINSNLHYGPYARDWWIPNLKIANNMREKFSDVQNTPSKAIHLLYQELFGGQTEHSGLAVFGFYNEEIISEILTDISFFPLFIKVDKFSIVVSKIGFSSRKDLLYAGPGYISSLLTRCGSETYLILQQVLNNCCSLRIGHYSREFNQQGTSIVLETFKAASSPNEEN
ncbi:3165_t:CDS:2, partial [Racocetra persica]